MFNQVFVAREYELAAKMSSGGLIVDCGANVGYSAAWFLTRFPDSFVVALEPDPGNFNLLELNTLRFGNRIKTLKKAVWSHECGLVFEKSPFRDGLSWSVRVREALEGEKPEVMAVDISTLLRESGASRIGLLKIDIERSEVVVFGPSCSEWLDRCDCIAIELHDEECEQIFFNAIKGQPFSVSRSGETVVCVRVSEDTLHSR